MYGLICIARHWYLASLHCGHVRKREGLPSCVHVLERVCPYVTSSTLKPDSTIVRLLFAFAVMGKIAMLTRSKEYLTVLTGDSVCSS